MKKDNNIRFIDERSLLVVTVKGQMRQLFTPFNVQVLQDTEHFKQNSWVVVEEIRQHPQYMLIYRVFNHWWPYYLFKIEVKF